MDYSQLVTSTTLLEELKNTNDNIAWDRFYSFYAPLIIAFCLKKGCTKSVAEDVLQESMVQFLTIIPKFKYDPKVGKFRSFLLRVVDCRIIDAYRREKLIHSATPMEKTKFLEKFADPRSTNLGAEWDRLWENNLFVHALDRVKEKISRVTYQSFQLYVLENQTAEEVAEQLNLNKNAIFQHKNRVIKLLQKEINKLKEEFGE